MNQYLKPALFKAGTLKKNGGLYANFNGGTDLTMDQISELEESLSLP